MIAAALLAFLWAEILQATNMLRNACPVINMTCTPFEKWTVKKPDLSKLRVLGCKAFCQIEKGSREGKFGAVGYRGVLVNYSASNLAYRVWNYEKHKVYDVGAPAFDEEADPGWWRVAADR